MMRGELKYKKIIKRKTEYLQVTKLKIPSIREEFQRRTDELAERNTDILNKVSGEL